MNADQYKYYRAFSHFKHDNSKQAVDFYKMIYQDIPVIYRLFVLLNILYAEFEIGESVINIINQCLADETELVKPNADLSLKYAERSKEYEKELSKFIRKMEEKQLKQLLI